MRERDAASRVLGDEAVAADVAAVVEERHVASWLQTSEALDLDAHGSKKDMPIVIEMTSVPTMGQTLAAEESRMPIAVASPRAPPKKGGKKKKKKILDPEVAAKADAALAAAAVETGEAGGTVQI